MQYINRIRSIIRKTTLMACAALMMALALTGAYAENTLDNTLIPYLENNAGKAIVFASELNLSNGDPYSRAYGERYMFGRLESGERVTAQMDVWLPEAKRITAEVKRLLLGPWKNNGRSECEPVRVGPGYALDLSSGTWRKTDGGMAIRIRHITEYYNRTRFAFILQDENGMTLYRREA